MIHQRRDRLTCVSCWALAAFGAAVMPRVAITVMPLATAALGQPPEGTAPGAVFLEAWRITANAFYRRDMNGVDWNAIRTELEHRAAAAKTPAELSAVISDALARLHASHTGHYTPDQREYYELLDIFWPEGVPAREGSAIRPGPATYTGIGVATRTIDGHMFVLDAYDGGPAAKAGILPGDELIAVEDGPWADIAPFRDRAGKPTVVTIQRTTEAGSRQRVEVIPEVIRPRELFLASVKASARLIERNGRKIAYVRIRSYSHPSYHEALKDLLADELSGADGLVLDVRGGWGGASPAYMDIFNPAAPTLTYIARDGKERVFSPTWHKPVAMLIDGGSRSGKEALAYAFKKHRVGVLVGERTAGFVLGGTVRPLADGSALYLAVNDIRVDGENLEGVGVEPDLVVARSLPYSAGKDPQLEAAVDALAARAMEPLDR